MFLRPVVLGVLACLGLLGAVPTGAIYVTSLPTDADVWLDGTYVGHSPVVVDALAAGRHTVSLNRTGWTSQDVDVSVVAGTTSLSCTALARANAAAIRLGDGSFILHGLAVRSLVLDGAALPLSHDGTYVAASGVHQLIAQTESGKVTRSITVYPAMRTDVLLHSDAAAPHSAVVAPASDFLPAAAMHVDGSHVVIRYDHHSVDAQIGETTYRFDGRSVTYDAAPTRIGNEMYLPLELLKALTAAHADNR